MTEVVAERRMYLPGLSVLLLLLLGGEAVLGWWLRRCAAALQPWSILTGLGLAALVGFTGVTLIRANDYDTDLKVWQQTARVQPGSSMAMNNLVVALLRENEPALARREVERLDEVHPNYLKLPVLWDGFISGKATTPTPGWRTRRRSAASRTTPRFWGHCRPPTSRWTT